METRTKIRNSLAFEFSRFRVGARIVYRPITSLEGIAACVFHCLHIFASLADKTRRRFLGSDGGFPHDKLAVGKAINNLH